MTAMLTRLQILEGSATDAARALAERMVALRHGAPRTEKAALDKTALLQEIGHAVRDNPTLGKALLGGGLGAAVGLGSSFMGDRDEDEPPNHLSSALTGALAGSAIGGGMGLAQRFWPGVGQQTSGGPAPEPPGRFADPRTGRSMQWDPEAFRKNPDLLQRIQAIHEQQNPQPDLLSRTLSPVRNYVTSHLWPTVATGTAVADFARQTAKPGANRFLTANVDPRNATDPEYLRRGAETITKTPKEYTALGNPTHWGWLQHETPEKLEELARARHPEGYASLGTEPLRQAKALGVKDYMEETHGEKAAPRLKQTLLRGRQFDPRALRSRVGGGLARAALYGSMPLIEGAVRSGINRAFPGPTEDLEELIRQHARPVE